MANIICFSTVDWDHLWYHPQALMSHFAKDGHQVIYVETIGLRSPKLKDFGRVRSRIWNLIKSKLRGLKQTNDGVLVYSPFVFPCLNSRLAQRLNVWLLVRALRKLVKGSTDKPIFWVYLPTQTVLACIKRMPYKTLVYNSIDALDESPLGVSDGYAAAEREILEQADLVLTTSETLYQQKVVYNTKTYWVPSGVDACWFREQTRATAVRDHAFPRIGFFGAIDHRLNFELIITLAKRHRDWAFLFIGSVRSDISTLQAEENIFFLGSKTQTELVDYVADLDVVFLPYVLDAFTHHIQPAKLFECLAVGKPVVSVSLPALVPFEGLVTLVDDFDTFDQALVAAVENDPPVLKDKRRSLAKANSWERRYQEILLLVEEASQ